MFISTAMAQTVGAPGASMQQTVGMIVQFGLIFAVFYFLLIRPQQKKVKEHQDMLASIKRGDKIVTGGGIYAKVVKAIGDSKLLVDINDDVRITIQRYSVDSVIGAEDNQNEKKSESKKKSDKKGKSSEALKDILTDGD